MLKGYIVPGGYMGWIDNEKRYQLFSCEQDYIEFMEDNNA